MDFDFKNDPLGQSLTDEQVAALPKIKQNDPRIPSLKKALGNTNTPQWAKDAITKIIEENEEKNETEV